MKSNSIIDFIKSSLLIVILLTPKIQAMDTGDDFEESHPKTAQVANSWVREEFRHNLLLEYNLFLQVMDSPPVSLPFPCFRLIFEKDNKLGALQIVLSNHVFPFYCLSEGHRMVILNSDYLVHEISSQSTKSTPGELGISPATLQKFFSHNKYFWFSALDLDAQNRLINDAELILFLRSHFDIYHQENNVHLFNHFHPALLFHYLIDRLYYRKRAMDVVATEHFGEWSGLEPIRIHETAVLQSLALSPEVFTSYFSSTEDQFYQAFVGYEFVQEDNVMPDPAMETRNRYWLNNTFTAVLQPGKLGLEMFGGSHARGPHGIITSIMRIRAKTDWAKNKRSPAQKRFWNGVHLLRFEYLQGRVWVEVPTPQ